MAQIWQTALGIERIGIHDQFFELGGNSLIGMTVISRIEKDLGVKISAASLFEGPTIASLGELLSPTPQATSTLDDISARGKARRDRMRNQHRQIQAAEDP